MSKIKTNKPAIFQKETSLTLQQFLHKYLNDFARDGYREEWRVYLEARWQWMKKGTPESWSVALDAYKQIPNRPNKIFP